MVRTVRLLGIREDSAQNGKASKFLLSKTKGKRVYLKFDAQKHDTDNHLLVYLYLEVV